ncbi:hypothetical protein AGABI1DRAFT_77188 [Agaricus bisporus var. burnettii JB137-S8]|uniref:SMP-30/Gluconolactonase/LRE-like region domain-containing protein n=1 Tax=Agaricus bisporus var. burnettii (strain JB137-S8 / ATCC MYA-4627 / FGSC 10392) TaxID=597362 RepID=K5XRX9_AGABU|nr:uncharacterized protein AGABI1DRAFT_77188 [Agaricus bisporus var. burnettii JB137-S8]EKM77645.1 hypothetical protein AGABI1DRAFT_77188 [Agaricus bisporus var. burnettii JB137-S8]
MSDINHNNAFFKLSLSEAEEMLGSGGNNKTVNVPITQIPLSDSIQMTSGGTGPFNGNLMLSNSGRGPLPPTLALVNSKPPYNSTILLNNFYGRQYNSLNDVKVHPTSGNLFFSDTTYGSIQQFRDKPTLPSQVYRFDMNTGAVQVVANNFDQANGIAFTGDGKTVYIGDSGAAGGTPTQPSTIYAFDVDEKTQALSNRRVLAYIDAGAPDGIQVDEKGNVYVACADGVQVFAPDGTLLGKFFLDISSANMVFAGPGRMVILAETKVFLAKISENTKGVVS